MAKSRGGQAIRARRGRSETSSLPISACPGGGWCGPMDNWRRIAERSRRVVYDEKALSSGTAAVKYPPIRKSRQHGTRLNAA